MEKAKAKFTINQIIDERKKEEFFQCLHSMKLSESELKVLDHKFEENIEEIYRVCYKKIPLGDNKITKYEMVRNYVLNIKNNKIVCEAVISATINLDENLKEKVSNIDNEELGNAFKNTFSNINMLCKDDERNEETLYTNQEVINKEKHRFQRIKQRIEADEQRKISDINKLTVNEKIAIHAYTKNSYVNDFLRAYLLDNLHVKSIRFPSKFENGYDIKTQKSLMVHALLLQTALKN